MALIDELKERRDRQEEVLDQVAEAIKEREEYRLRVEQELDDLDIAIAALTPAPAPVEIEIPEGVPVIPTTEWTEPLSGLAPDLSSDDPDEQDDASEFAEPYEAVEDKPLCVGCLVEEGLVHEADCPVLADERAAEMRDEAPALNADMQDDREQPVQTEPDGYAHVTNPTIDDLIPEAMRQELEAEQRYAQPTNPDADERAKLNDWYDPKAVHERNRFNPFSMFKREDA